MSSPAAAATEPFDTSLLAHDQFQVVRQYAEALVNAAEEAGQAESVLDELGDIEPELYKTYPRFRDLLGSTRVAAAEKDRILVLVFENRLSDLSLRFLRVLNRHGRLGSLAQVAREATKLWNRRHKLITVYVTSAVPLDEGQQAALREQVSRMIAAEPILQITTDPSLIGGLIVQVGDQVTDASVRGRLQQVRQRLIEGKTHEIQSRRDQFSHPA